MESLTIEDFQPWLGQGCEVVTGEHRLPMTLTAAEPVPGSLREGGGFRLEFRGPTAPVLAQAIMAVHGPTGNREIFLVPIARDAQAARYEAVFY